MSNGQANIAFGESLAPTAAICGNKQHSQDNPCTARAAFQNTPDSLCTSDQVLCHCTAHYDRGHRRMVGQCQGKPRSPSKCPLFTWQSPLPMPSTRWLQPPALVCFCMLDRDGLKCIWGLEEKVGFLLDTKTPPPRQWKLQNYRDSFPILSSMPIQTCV